MNLDAAELPCANPLREIRTLARTYDWIIIDGPPGIGRISAEIVRVSDMVLMPTKPSPFDVWACADIVEAVNARQESTAGIPRASFVITMARPRTRLLGRKYL